MDFVLEKHIDYVYSNDEIMKTSLYIAILTIGLPLCVHSQQIDPDSLFQPLWLDIGAYHNIYSSAGARPRNAGPARGMEYPAIQRHSSHEYGNGFWIGVKDWTDADGVLHPFHVVKIGPLSLRDRESYPIKHSLYGRYSDTLVEVDGVQSSNKEAVLDQIDPGLAADRAIHNIHNMPVGITTNRWIYAYTNPYHDNYHIIHYNYCNTGNIDGDEEIELENQSLQGVYFFRTHRWPGNEQATWNGAADQFWGRYTIYDVVGDGFDDYPVDFTAQYSWIGPDYFGPGINLGRPLTSDEHETVADGDSLGRLSSHTMAGRSLLHADVSPTDATHDIEQPRTMSWIDNDGFDRVDRSEPTPQQYYQLRIQSDHFPNPGYFPPDIECSSCSGRIYPHMATRLFPHKEFWNYPIVDLLQGGFSATTAYGPYDMGPGECIDIVVSEGVAGLSFDAAAKVGMSYVGGGGNGNEVMIEYDANGDGSIDATPFDYDEVFVGTERQTKNQWVLSARDSLFQTFYRARDLFSASDKMSRYPIVEPPRPPSRFSVSSEADRINLEWDRPNEGPQVTGWEIYRTDKWPDNLYGNNCLTDQSIICGYELIATLSPELDSFPDTTARVGDEYFYYIQAVGEAQNVDPLSISGTPSGEPLKSGRYLAQTYTSASLIDITSSDPVRQKGAFELDGHYPNPSFGETTISYRLATPSMVNLNIYDLHGRLLERLVEEDQVPGRHLTKFDTSSFVRGVYFYALEVDGVRKTGRLVVY